MSVVSIKKESLASIMAANDTESSKASVADLHIKPELAAAPLVDMPINSTEVKFVEPSKPVEPSKFQLQFKAFMQWLLPPVFGLLMLLAVWALIAAQAQGLPGPIKTFQSAVELFSHAFE